MENNQKRVLRLIFICYGNICRSPMAEGLARKVFQQTAQVTSAGIAPSFTNAMPETIEVMQSCFGIDLLGHQSQSIGDIFLDSFDHIISMDAYIFQELTGNNPHLRDKIIGWDIEDPYGDSLDKHRKCAEQIEEHVHALFNDLSSRSA